MTTPYSNKTIKKYLDDLSARRAVPGGGSAAALTGALGASLMSMVVRFSVDKPGYRRHRPWFQQALKKTERSRFKLMELSDDDCRAFAGNNRAKLFSVPRQVVDTCAGVLRLSPELARKANIHLISDVAVAAALLEVAARSAGVTIETNLSLLKNERRKKMIRLGYMRTLRSLARICRTTEVLVGTIIRGKTDSRAHQR